MINISKNQYRSTWLTTISLCILAMLGLSSCTGIPDGIQAVGNFQINRYLGTWYEIARLDHSFERGMNNISATYSTRADGGIDVLNRGFDPIKSEWREAHGRAFFIGNSDVASLKVSFFGPFYGGYHVFALDNEYRWAVISGPTREYLWILAREPVLSPDILASLVTRARQAGFKTNALIYAPARPIPAVDATSPHQPDSDI